MKDLYPDVNWMKEKDYYNKYWIAGCGGNFHFQKEGARSASCKNNNPDRKKGSGIWIAYNNDKTSVAAKSFYDRNGYWFICENDEYATDDVKYGEGEECPRAPSHQPTTQPLTTATIDHPTHSSTRIPSLPPYTSPCSTQMLRAVSHLVGPAAVVSKRASAT